MKRLLWMSLFFAIGAGCEAQSPTQEVAESQTAIETADERIAQLEAQVHALKAIGRATDELIAREICPQTSTTSGSLPGCHPQTHLFRGGELENVVYATTPRVIVENSAPWFKESTPITGHLDNGNEIDIVLRPFSVDPCFGPGAETSTSVVLFKATMKSPRGIETPLCSTSSLKEVERRCPTLHSLAIVVPGYWAMPKQRSGDSGWGRHGHPERFTISCVDGAMAKCVLWGYDPKDVPDYYEACIDAARAAFDPQDRDRSYTLEGEVADFYDQLPINVREPDPHNRLVEFNGLSFLEAQWGPNGNICVNHYRVEDYPIPPGRPTCPDSGPFQWMPGALLGTDSGSARPVGWLPDSFLP
jgi:hypothetical protein